VATCLPADQSVHAPASRQPPLGGHTGDSPGNRQHVSSAHLEEVIHQGQDRPGVAEEAQRRPRDRIVRTNHEGASRRRISARRPGGDVRRVTCLTVGGRYRWVGNCTTCWNVGRLTQGIDGTVPTPMALNWMSSRDGLHLTPWACPVPAARPPAGFDRLQVHDAGSELWVDVPVPAGKASWVSTIATLEAAGATGVIVPWDPRLIDLLRSAGEPDDRTDLLIAAG